MAIPSRRKTTSVIDRLEKEPWRFSFFQAVRLLQNAFGRKKTKKHSLETVGSDSSPSQELISFSSPPSMAYATSDITRISNNNTQHKMNVSFMGVAGTNGALPNHYTEFMLQRQRSKDNAMRDFYDLFNHRSISLFYRAWKKHRLPFNYEAHKIHTQTVDPITNALQAFIGRRSSPIDSVSAKENAEKTLFFSGIYASPQRSAATLAKLLSDYFNIPVFIEEFIGEWGELYEDDRSTLGKGNKLSGQNNKLGMNTIIGSRAYCVESRFRIVIGPLQKNQLDNIKPGSQSLHDLCEFTRGYVGPNVKFDLKMKLNLDSLECARLKCKHSGSSNLGWNTWLINKKHSTKQGQEVEMLLPSQGL